MLATRSPSSAFTSSDRQAVEQLFVAFDTDGSGGIDRAELVHALNELGLSTDERTARAILTQYDADRSGVLELNEFDTLMMKIRDFMQCKAKALAQPPDEVANMFAAFDADESYSIEATELRAALNTVGLATGSEQAASILRKYDADGNGRLDADEFRKLVGDLRKYQQRIGCAIGCGLRLPGSIA